MIAVVEDIIEVDGWYAASCWSTVLLRWRLDASVDTDRVAVAARHNDPHRPVGSFRKWSLVPLPPANRLRAARIDNGLSLSVVSRAIKVPAVVLLGIECGDIKAQGRSVLSMALEVEDLVMVREAKSRVRRAAVLERRKAKQDEKLQAQQEQDARRSARQSKARALLSSLKRNTRQEKGNDTE